MRLYPSISSILSLLITLHIAGCKELDIVQEQTIFPAFFDDELNGKGAYDMVCATCHETGVNGAPRTRYKEDWLERSWLWEAVIFEHAKNGFLDMPAKGGASALDDVTVEKAAEYMLSITFPMIQPSDE